MTDRLDTRITNREFKLLLKPQGLDRRSNVIQLCSLFRAFCEKEAVEFFTLDNAATGLRNVYFFDTPSEDFRTNKLILRVRESRRNVWIDDWCEVTMKCRADTIERALEHDPTPKTKHKYRRRLKEEILRGDKLGSRRSIYSNNAILDAVPIEDVFERKLASVIRNFPALKHLDIDPKVPIRVVGGHANKILEACLPIGNINFGDRVNAHCDLAIWMRSVGQPIIGELAFAYRVTDHNRDDHKAHRRADKFFLKLQHALIKWLASGSTKTALIYAKPE